MILSDLTNHIFQMNFDSRVKSSDPPPPLPVAAGKARDLSVSGS